MRKTLLVIATLFITAQVFAATVTIEVTDIGDGWASIRYSADANVSAFGLKVTADSGATFTDIDDYNVGECTASQKGYGIFPGTIDINEDTGVVDGNGTPVAPDTDPGAEGTGIDTNTLILEMGALYVEGNEPALSGTLIKVQVDQSCRVCVEGEPIRGDIVMTDGTAVEANDCEYIMLGCLVPDVVGMSVSAAEAAIEAADLVPVIASGLWGGTIDTIESQNPTDGGTIVECGSAVNLVVWRGPQPANPISTDPAYSSQYAQAAAYIANVWDPTGWNPGSGYQCIGDAMNNTEIAFQNYRVYHTDLTLLVNSWMKKAGAWPNGADPRADIDHKSEVAFQNYRVYSSDLTRFVCYWMKKDADIGPGPCPFTDAANNAWTCPW